MRPMTDAVSPVLFRRGLFALVILTALAGLAWWPATAMAVSAFVVSALIEVAPLVIPGLLLSAWVNASGAGDGIARAFTGRAGRAVIVAAAIGAITPVCGVTVLPLMAGLLAAGVPLAPVMAFWLSSPITDPTMLAATAATLGLDFAVGKTVAAFGLGLLGGFGTAWLTWPSVQAPLRWTGLTSTLTQSAPCASSGFRAAIWREADRRARFGSELLAMTRLLLICLIPAFAAEFALNATLEPQALSAYVGRDTWWAVPLAVFVGAPAYIDGYAALPVVRGLIDHGMAPGAAMAFLVSGGVVSIWGAMAIAPVLRMTPFLLYLGFAAVGSLAAGWIFGWVV